MAGPLVAVVLPHVPRSLMGRALAAFQLPVLLKGTSDDDIPCPGYLFEEIAKISHESPGSSHCLLEYLLDRLHSGSGRVKLKVLKILLHLCAHGSPSFLLILKRNPVFIQEAAAFTGPPDPLHGSSLYQKVRAAAQDLGSALFSDVPPPPPSQPSRALPAAGMGSQSRPQSALQGFGYSKGQGHTGSAGEAFLSTIQKAAEVVANAVRPGPGTCDTQGPLQGDAYQAAVTPAASLGHPTPGNLPPGAVPGIRAVRHRPGQAGGGWEEQESSPGSQGSSQENGRSKASDSGSQSGSDSPSGASRAPSDMAERVEAMTLSDCQQELSLVRLVAQGPRAFLSQEEAQHFIKECGLLNCEAVLELLIRHLGATSEREQLILRHFEASCRQRPLARRPLAEPGPAAARTGPSDLLTDAVPFAGGQAFLQPLSSTLFSLGGPAPPCPLDGSPFPGPGDTREAETRLAGSREQGPGSEQSFPGPDTPDTGPELCPGPSNCPWSPVTSSHHSLFAGMELVACPRLVGAGIAAEEPPQVPWTLSQRVAAKEPSSSEPSAFAFLNS
ncbi:AP-4 complex accessory subunit tepsin isoform X3 [Rousettus aegyptiacus]|uniref:AP-4 complex accessory subunit tepsin isoform X3 n=1 Tax=Rousettus aegyptiacus TaxID=9407 RepID=UPI00168D4A40|nr:AP-4 complex accessory subunit tepsin isoform X3 [Rousettus aegyptiacus]